MREKDPPSIAPHESEFVAANPSNAIPKQQYSKFTIAKINFSQSFNAQGRPSPSLKSERFLFPIGMVAPLVRC